MPKPEIFFSYGWGDANELGVSREKFVNDLYDSLAKASYPMVRDKPDLEYKGLIKGFMERLGKAAIIIVVVSDKYLKSPNCMFELLEIYKRSNSDPGEMREKIFPVLLEDATIAKDAGVSAYTSYWETKQTELEEEMKKGLSNRAEIAGSLEAYRDIATNNTKLLRILAGMNTLNAAQLAANDFQLIKQYIDQRTAALKDSKPRTVYNEILTRGLLEAMAMYNKDAAAFVQDAAGNYPAWEKDIATSADAQLIISSSFPGSLGAQFSRLWAIGQLNESNPPPDPASIQASYLKNSFHLAKMTLQLLCFAFISRLWDYKNVQNVAIPDNELNIIRSFFERKAISGTDKYMSLLQALVSVFGAFPAEAPFTEFADLQVATLPGSGLVNAVKKLQTIEEDSRTDVSFAACLDAEKELAAIFAPLGFLSGYKMVSIKEISYYALRNMVPHYLHNYTELGLDRNQQVNIDRINYLEIPGNTDAIFLFKLDYWKGTNLFPFMINFSGLNLQGSPTLYFYSKIGFGGNSLEYYSWEDNTSKNIAATSMDSAKYSSQPIMDQEGIKSLKRNIVLWQFEEAKRSILGTQPGTLLNTA